MLTISQAAKELKLSEGRTRALVASGKLEAEKCGRQWMVYERSVEKRAAQGGHVGRPRKTEGNSNRVSDPALDQAYSLYLACRDQASKGHLSSLIQNARSAEERDFYVCLMNFFLGKRCEQLAKEGAY